MSTLSKPPTAAPPPPMAIADQAQKWHKLRKLWSIARSMAVKQPFGGHLRAGESALMERFAFSIHSGIIS